MYSLKHNKAIRQELFSLAEPNYQKFATSLIPDCENLIGVRIPLLRKIARHLANDNPLDYLNQSDEKYFEEVMIKGLLIGNLRKTDLDTILAQITTFIPKITNWSLCDSFCSELKIVKKYRERFWEFFTPYWQSEHPFKVRTAVVIALFYFIDLDYLPQLFARFNQIKHDNYYVKMAIAWAISICYIKFPDATLPFLKINFLDTETHNKALQKICESTRPSLATKQQIKLLKRTNLSY